MKLLETLDGLHRLGLRNIGIVRDILRDLETGLIGHVVLENVQNEAFLNGLTHGIDMEGMEGAILPLGSEDFQRRALGRGGKGKEG